MLSLLVFVLKTNSINLITRSKKENKPQEMKSNQIEVCKGEFCFVNKPENFSLDNFLKQKNYSTCDLCLSRIKNRLNLGKVNLIVF